VLSFSSVVGIGTPPTPHPQGQFAPPPLLFWVEGHTRWRDRGWESPNSEEGTYNVAPFIFKYFVYPTYTHTYAGMLGVCSVPGANSAGTV